MKIKFVQKSMMHENELGIGKAGEHNAVLFRESTRRGFLRDPLGLSRFKKVQPPDPGACYEYAPLIRCRGVNNGQQGLTGATCRNGRWVDDKGKKVDVPGQDECKKMFPEGIPKAPPTSTPNPTATWVPGGYCDTHRQEHGGQCTQVTPDDLIKGLCGGTATLFVSAIGFLLWVRGRERRIKRELTPKPISGTVPLPEPAI